MATSKRSSIPLDLMTKPITENPSAPSPRIAQPAAKQEQPTEAPAAPAPAPTQAEPATAPASSIAPAAQAEAEPQRQLVPIFSSPSTAVALQPIMIAAPIHERTAGGEAKSLTVKVDAPRFRRLARCKAETELSTQQILSEALDIWLAHNGF